ncbi:DNA oxidative demethylase ALKBH2 [Anabrus simplex]|uniref:DNA oxidative demethylase ALKBH2 n=1 Tax=Anabrus simplex TaxID=316456 RepID=UPI0034DD5215
MDTKTSSIRAIDAIDKFGLRWQKLSAEGLNLDYTIVLPRLVADKVLKELEADIEYFTGDLARVFVFGKWHPIPRQQVAFGDEGLTYTFSGNTVPARPWPPLIRQLRDMVQRITGVPFNFVLVNRYRDGNDHMGEHRDDEKELDCDAPIASLSLGQRREFVLRHRDARDARTPGSAKRNIPPYKVMLEHGSLLLMNPPTNQLWYHSLPRRKSCMGVRINLTFRKFVT